MSVPEDELLAVAHEAAGAAAKELMSRFGGHVGGIRTKSTATDPVSEADLAAEAEIRRVLGARRPADAILGEEGGATGDGALRWIVDPLDGTVNFLFAIPQFSVSVACQDADGMVVGVVLDPVREETFAATRSGSPTLNGQTISGSSREDLATALVATGFAYDAAVRAKQAVVMTRVLPRVRDIRRAGSAALDLAWLACGRYDAYYERGVNLWDYAAGALIASRAGLSVRELAAADDGPAGLAAAAPALMDPLLGLILDGAPA
ncbi:MAG TPA: inositol monophosphatase family protein [Solirubrobacteraceae bacterium]|jgi:myo-inositol-1(or 4)-monophosphatase